MNKIERMQAVFAGKAPDYTPAGFWFHYPADLTAEEAARPMSNSTASWTTISSR